MIRYLRYLKRILCKENKINSIILPCGKCIKYSNKGGSRFVALKKDISFVRGWEEIEYKSTKEPETVQWLDALPVGSVLWDIGANVGSYTLYAAIEKTLRVLAFEPSFSNYEALNYNISLNGVDQLIRAYCIALNNKKSIEGLQMQNIRVGKSGSSFGRARDHRGVEYEPTFVQGGVGISIDAFVDEFSADVPDAIKMDVDGNEGLILDGAQYLLGNTKLKYLSIELNEALEAEIEKILLLLKGYGFEFVGKFVASKNRIDEEGYIDSTDRNHNYHFQKKEI